MVTALGERGHEVLALGREELDLADPDSLSDSLELRAGDRVIICAAMTAVDACEHERELADRINAKAPGVIAEIATAQGAHVTLISTDFVFDGSKDGPYEESDEPNPLGEYGASKLAGECAVLAASERHLVVRVSWLYGRHRPAFPEWIIAQARDKEVLALPAEKTGSPTSCEDLADSLPALLDPPQGEPASGIVHFCNSGSCSWQEWGQACLDYAVASGENLLCREIGANRMDDITAFVAKRPLNSVLDTSRFEQLTGTQPRDWHLALREHLVGSEQGS